MFLDQKVTRKQFLRSFGILGLYAWLMSSVFGCLFDCFDEPVSGDQTPASDLNRANSPSSSDFELPHLTRHEKTQVLSSNHLVEAQYYSKLSKLSVLCQLCFRNCIIPEGGRGFCLARENRGGKLYALTYGIPVAIHIDPIEKEPLFHMLPGSDTLCVGTATCNLRCKNCINWHIAHKAPEEVEAMSMMPEEIVNTALERNVTTLCFTYNEPTQQYEYMYDIAVLARKEGLRVTCHSNGGMNIEPLKSILPYLDSVSIDLKAFNPVTYRQLTTGELQPVLDSLKLIKKQGVWLEIICLIIPTWTDDFENIRAGCNWIGANLGHEVPVHFSRFFPTCKLTGLPPTALGTLEQAYDLARQAGLQYVYIGNVSGHDYCNTYCPQCSNMIIERKGLFINQNKIDSGQCRYCGHNIPGIWT